MQTSVQLHFTGLQHHNASTLCYYVCRWTVRCRGCEKPVCDIISIESQMILFEHVFVDNVRGGNVN